MEPKSRPNSEQWKRLRALWESDPTMSQYDVAKMAGVSQVAVQKRIKRESWNKVANQSDLARRAYDKADEEALKNAHPGPEQAIPSVDGSEPPLAVVMADNTVAMKAKVLERHRKEVDGVRNHLYRAIQNSDVEKARLAKTSAETMRIVQELERKSWGLDRDESEKNQVVVVVKREEN